MRIYSVTDIVLTESDISRFVSKLKRDEQTGCLLFTGSKVAGYGAFWVGTKTTGAMHRASRIAWVIAGNKITSDRPFILHSCDNRACCEITHLRAGTSAENSVDMAKRERGTKSKSGLPKGVRRLPHGRFVAQAKSRNQMLYLGSYDTVKEAATRAKEFRIALYGPDCK